MLTGWTSRVPSESGAMICRTAEVHAEDVASLSIVIANGRHGVTRYCGAPERRRNRATALIEDIRCSKIRGCSYRGKQRPLLQCPLCPDCDQIPHRIKMTRCAI